MKKFNSFLYTQGKFGHSIGEVLDDNNPYLYSKGKYSTKLIKDDLPEYYVKIKSRTISYMVGYLKVVDVKDIKYHAVHLNHLFKDDFLYISYNKEIKKQKDRLGFDDYYNYDICICGNDILKVLFEIEKYSKIDTSKVKQDILNKFLWWKEKYKDEYLSMFGNADIDIFKYYEERLK